MGTPSRERLVEERVRVVLVTAPDAETAAGLARELLERRLVACANLLPGVRSLYRWQGCVEDELEVLVLLKTTRGRLRELEQAIDELHPYEVPEFVALTPDAVGGAYRAWLEGQVLAATDAPPADGGEADGTRG